MLHERRHSGNLCVLKTYLLNSAGFSFAFAGRGDLLTGTFKALGRGQRERRDKSSGPPLLKLSLKVKRNSTHGQSSAFVVAPGSPKLALAARKKSS
jgi:hypothetical protein